MKQVIHRGLVLLVLLVTILSIAPTMPAGAMDRVISGDSSARAREDFTDFHVDISSPGGSPITLDKDLIPTLTINGGSTVGPSISGDGTTHVQLDWTVQIPQNAILNWFWIATQYENNKFTTGASYTLLQALQTFRRWAGNHTFWRSLFAESLSNACLL